MEQHHNISSHDILILSPVCICVKQDVFWEGLFRVVFHYMRIYCRLSDGRLKKVDFQVDRIVIFFGMNPQYSDNVEIIGCTVRGVSGDYSQTLK